MTVVL